MFLTSGPSRKKSSGAAWSNNQWLLDLAKTQAGIQTGKGPTSQDQSLNTPPPKDDDDQHAPSDDDSIESDDSKDGAPAPLPSQPSGSFDQQARKRTSRYSGASWNPWDAWSIIDRHSSSSPPSGGKPDDVDDPSDVDSDEPPANRATKTTSRRRYGGHAIPRPNIKFNFSKHMFKLSPRRRNNGKGRRHSQSHTPSSGARTNNMTPNLLNAEVRLYQTIQELENSKRVVDHLASTKRSLEEQNQLLQDQVSELTVALEEKDEEIASLVDDMAIRVQLLKFEGDDVAEVTKAKDFQIESLREQLDQAHFKLRKAERRNRYVDDADRWKADAKYRKKQKATTSELFGFPSYEADEHREEILKERRGAQGLVAKSVDVVTGMMSRFNEDIFQAAASYSDVIENEGFERASMSTANRDRADRVLGARLVSMVLPTVPRPKGAYLDPLIVQVVVQVFLVYWCNQIIEAWYPKQATFAEFLVDVSSKLKVGTNLKICGTKTIITQKHTRDSDMLFNEWVADIMEDLCVVLSIFGWRIQGYNTSSSATSKQIQLPFIQNGLLTLVKNAYDLRTAMAEISTSGDVDLVIVSYDTPFNDQRMEDTYSNSWRGRKRDGEDPTALESVIATTGIGLQREVLRNQSGFASRDIEMVLKPHVVLEYTLSEALEGI